MEVIVAKSAGFCFGVEKAVESVYSEIEKNMEQSNADAFHSEEKNDSEFDFLTSSEPVQDGNLVSYKKMQTLEIVDAVVDSNKYPLHKAFLGKRVGDLVVMNGRRYLIISVL